MNAGLESDFGNIQVKRLLSLIEFAQHAALFRASPVADITNTAITTRHHDLPGVRVNVGTEEAEGDLWMVVERLQEIHPPRPKSGLLGLWLELSNDPTKVPALKAQVTAQQLMMVGAVSLTDKAPAGDPKAPIALETFPQREAVETQFNEYLERQWKPWSDDEAAPAQPQPLQPPLHREAAPGRRHLGRAAGAGLGRRHGGVDDGKKVSPGSVTPSRTHGQRRTLAIEVRPRN
jgi:hypothetical protein